MFIYTLTGHLGGLLMLEPLAWFAAIGAFLCNGLLKDEIKGYDVYSGLDVNGKNIIVLIRKENYDPKYDIIKYDKIYVQSVSEKPLRGKIKA